MSTAIQCPCGSSRRQRVAAYDAPPPGETAIALGGQLYRRAYDQCQVCGHYMAVHDLDLSHLYEGDYVAATYQSSDGMRGKFDKISALPPERSDNYWRVKRIDEYARGHFGHQEDTLTLLDVGTGLGIFPAGMKKAGWDCSVVDPDARAVEHARSYLGMAGFCGDFLKVPESELGKYHVVTFNKVLEHVADPAPLLHKAGRHLRPGGLVYIELPDVAAANDAAGHDREEFFIEHLHIFSPASLAIFIQNASFDLCSLTRFREPSTKYTLAAFCTNLRARP